MTMTHRSILRPAPMGPGANAELERDHYREQAEMFRALLNRILAEWRDVPQSLRAEIAAALKDIDG
jgi:hypothetical protein